MDKKNEKTVWKDAAIVFVRITGWIAAPIVAAVIIGGKLDARAGTDIRWLLLCSGGALLISIVGITIEMKRYIKQVDREAELQKNDGDSHNN